MLTVYLNDDSRYVVNDFERVTFANGGSLTTITKDNLDSFFVSDRYTYRFYGENTVLVAGNQIKLIDLN